MLRAILNKSWRQHPTKQQLYGHLQSINKTIQVRRSRHAGHCRRSCDELISDELLWTLSHRRANAGRPARTYIQLLCVDTGCTLEDLPSDQCGQWDPRWWCDMMMIYIYIYQLLRSGRIWHKVSFFKRSLTGLNSEFSFSKTSYLTKAEEPSLPCYLPIAGGRVIGFIPFPRVLVLCEIQSVSSRIWTRVTVSISYDDNQSFPFPRQVTSPRLKNLVCPAIYP